MKTLHIKGQTGHSKVLVGERLANLARCLSDAGVSDLTNTVIITDEEVFHHYKDMLPPCDTIIIGRGEKIKTLQTVEHIYNELIRFGADRSTFLIGIGGGIVCDIAGFAASTYMRGIRFGFVSTTLLSQVDASVGGKNGVNLSGYKNMVGVFNQPEFVICDTDMLATLPPEELSCGFAEIVKHALIRDEDYLCYLEDHWEQALNLEPAVIEKIIYDSVVIKADIVNRDEREQGARKKLNFGHTFGHAFEKTTSIPHGQAVSAGMVMAARVSEKRGWLTADDVKRIETLLTRFRLPVAVPFNREEFMAAMTKDKKKEGDVLHFVLLHRIGEASVEKIPVRELDQML